jgi:fructose/tagatose bisphosphate aldolase
VYLPISLVRYILILLMKKIEVLIHIDKKIHGSSRIHLKSIWNHISKYVFKCNLHSEISIVSYYVFIKYL